MKQRPRSGARWTGALGALVLATLTGLVACSDDEPDTRPAPSIPVLSTTTSTTTTSPADQDEVALRGLAEEWFDTAIAIARGEVELASASEFLVDPYLSDLTANIGSKPPGQTARPSARTRTHVESVTIDGDQATVIECFVDAEVMVDAEGAVVDDTVVTARISTSAERTPSGWRFSDREFIEEEVESCPT